MFTQREIEQIVIDLLNRLGFNSDFAEWLRDLDTRRTRLRGVTNLDISQNRALVLITKAAKIQRYLVRETELRLDEDLNDAIGFGIQAITNWDYEEAIEGLPNFSDSS